MSKPCKYTLKGGKVLNFDEARAYVLENAKLLSANSPTLKSFSDAIDQIKEQESVSEKPEDRTQARQAEGTSTGNSLLGTAEGQRAEAEEVDPVIDFLDRITFKPGQANGFIIPLAPILWNGFVWTVKKGYIATKNLNEALAKGIQYLKDQGLNQDLIDEVVELYENLRTGKQTFDPEQTQERTQAIYERLAENARRENRPDLAEEFLKEGKYTVKKPQQTYDDAIALIDMLGEVDARHLAINDGTIAQDIRMAILGELYKRAEESGNSEKITSSRNDFAAIQKDTARALNMIGFMNERIPGLRFINDMAAADKAAEEAMGDPNNVTSDASKAKQIQREVAKIKKDTFSAISAALGGLIDAKELFDPNSQFFIKDAAMRNLFKKLVEFGGKLDQNGKGVLAAAIRSSLNAAGRLATREQIKAIIDANLRDFNGRVPVSIGESDLAELSDALMALYDLQSNAYIIANSKPDAPVKLNKDTFSAIANALGGLINIEEIFNQNSKNYVSDSKLRVLLKKLAEFGSLQKAGDLTMLQQAIKDSLEKSNRASSRKRISDLIQGGLNDFNGRVKVPMTEAQIAELHKTLMSLYDLDSNAYIIANSKPKAPARMKKDIFNTIANVIEGNIDSRFLFAYGYNPSNPKTMMEQFSGKMKGAMKVLVNWGEMMARDPKVASVFAQMMKNIGSEGLLATAENEAAAREIIENNLSQINGGLQSPMSPKNLAEVVDAFVLIYKEMASEKIAARIEQLIGGKALTLQGSINKRIGEALIFGVFDDAELTRLFAQKYGIPYLSPAQVANLQALYAGVIQAKGAFARNMALARYTSALNNVMQTGFWPMVNKWFLHIPAYIYNNILSSVSTMSMIIMGNLFRQVPIMLSSIGSGTGQSMKATYGTRSITLTNGAVVKLNLTENLFASSLRGNPSLLDQKSSGLTEVEQRIRDSNSLLGRRLMRTFQAPSGRIMTALDAASSPFTINLTKRQLFTKMLDVAYEETNRDLVSKGQPPLPPRTESDVNDDVSFLMAEGNYTSEWASAIERAMGDIKAGQLWSDLGFTQADNFDARFKLTKKNALSREAKVYLEMVNRANEIINEGELSRLNQIKQRRGLMDFGDLQELVDEIDKFAAQRTRALTMMGTPRGLEGYAASFVNDIAKKAGILKYVGVLPMFNNAIWNMVALTNSITPGINIAQYGLYKVRGKRTGDNYKNKFIINYDQKLMRDTMIASNTIAVAAVAAILALTGDDREKIIQMIMDRKYTGFTPTKFSSAQRTLFKTREGEILEEGYFYLNGEPMFRYNVTPFAGWFGAVAYLSDKLGANVFNYDYADNPELGRSQQMTDPWETEDKTIGQIAGGYFLNHLVMVQNSSSLRVLSDFVTGIISPGVGSPDNFTGDGKVMTAVEKQAAKTVQSFIPFYRLQSEAKNMYDAFTGRDEKVATTFSEMVSLGMMWEDAMIDNGRTDGFGRPVPEKLKVTFPSFGLNFIRAEGGDYDSPVVKGLLGEIEPISDPYLRLKFTKGYVEPGMRQQEIAMPIKAEGDESISDADINNMYDEVKAENVPGFKLDERPGKLNREYVPASGEYEISKMTVMAHLSKEETVKVNVATGAYVLKVLESNPVALSNLEKMPRREFIIMMDELYYVARRIAVATQQEDKIKQIKSAYQTATKNSAESWNKKYINQGVVIPSNLIPLNN